MAGPGWLPRGATPDPYVWAYDLRRGKWVSPEDKAPDDGQLVEMPPGFDPRGRGQGMHVVLSPPGVAAPPGAMAYSPATRSLHGPGEVPPLDLENLSVILAPRPGPPQPPPSPPQEVPSPMAGAPGGMGPAGPGPGSPMPPPSQAGEPEPPPGGMGPPQATQPPPGLSPMATPQQPMGAPGVGKPPSLYSQRAHQILQSLLGTPTPGMGPGVGQDVGAGSDVGVGAAITPPAAPADVNQNTLPGLTPSQAAAFCGPAGVLDLMQQYEGGNIPVDAVVQKAQQRDPRTGRPYWQGQMNGPQEFANLLDEFGYEPTMISLEGGNQASGWRQVESALRRGQRVVVDTPGHYFQLEGIDPSGAIRMGDVVGQRRGTISGPQDITSMGQGAPRTAITATPRAGGPAEARQAPGGGQVRLMSAQNSNGPTLGPQGVENAPNAPLVGVSRDQFAANAMTHANAASQIIRDNYGVEIPPEVLAGYAAHETGYGSNNLARNYGNFMSIYAPNPWTGTSRSFTGDNPVRTVQAATYNNPTESFVHFGQQMARNSRYAPALSQYQQDHDVEKFLQNVNRAGWAEDQNWWRGVLNSANTVRDTAARAGVQAGAAPTDDMQLMGNPSLTPSNLPDWLRDAVAGHVARTTNSTPSASAPANPDLTTEWNRDGWFLVQRSAPNNRVAGPFASQEEALAAGNPTTPRPPPPTTPGPVTQAAASALQWVRDNAGNAVPAIGGAAARSAQATGIAIPGTRAAETQARTAPPSTPTLEPEYGGLPSRAMYPPSARDDWRTNPGATPQPAQAPADPRLTAKDPISGLAQWGPAGTVIPSSGDTPWIPWVIYGPDEGDGLGKAIDDPQLIMEVRKAAAARYEHSIAQQLQQETRATERERLQGQFAIAQETSRSQREQQLMIANTAHEDRVARMQALEQERQMRREDRGNTMVGPAGAQVPQHNAPGGYFVDQVAGVAVALGADGQPIATYQVARPAPKSENVPGYGVQQETINPQTRQLEYTPTGQYPQQIVDRHVLQSSPRGYEVTGRLPEDPQVTRWTDPWGREMMMNQRTGERFVLNEGSPRVEQRGRHTYSVPPPATPRYTPPMYRPTTYGYPEVPLRQDRPALPPGAVLDPRGGYWIQRPDEPQQPQFVQPPPDEAPAMQGDETQPLPMEGSYS